MEQTITTDCSARSAYCTEKLAARPVQAQGTVSYESSDSDIASVDAATGEITAKKPERSKSSSMPHRQIFIRSQVQNMS